MLSHNWLFPDRVIGPAIVALLKCFRIICKARLGIEARIKARAFSRMYLLFFLSRNFMPDGLSSARAPAVAHGPRRVVLRVTFCW
jgi:hypothetical protein